MLYATKLSSLFIILNTCPLESDNEPWQTSTFSFICKSTSSSLYEYGAPGDDIVIIPTLPIFIEFNIIIGLLPTFDTDNGSIRFVIRLLTKLSITKTLKIFDTEKETSVNLTIDTSFNFINIYYGRFENSPVKISSIDINKFNIDTSEIIRLIGANDKMVLSCERISETNLKISVTEKLTEGVDSFKYIRVELSKI